MESQRKFFESGRTRDARFRRDSLARLEKAITGAENGILEALKSDLGKPAFEAWGSEIGPVLGELRFARRKMAGWMKQRRVSTPLLSFPGRSYIRPEPFGCVLIMAPWNYPFHLTLMPLVSAIAAGNCAVLKPSEFAPATARLMSEIVEKTFDPGQVTVVEGDAGTAEALLREKWDYILFSGSTAVGRKVMEAAAKNLTPLTLELGGKCPAIIAADADIAVSARRIAWGKFYNAGQTCVAPDYALVAESVREEFIAGLRKSITEFFGKNPAESPDYARIVNSRHFARLSGLMGGGRVRLAHGGRDLAPSGRVLCGGEMDRERLYIAPTVIGDVPAGGELMRDEIFGPLLPVLSFRDMEEAVRVVKSLPPPLSIYCFTRNPATMEGILGAVPSGGAIMNDTLVQMANPRLPFGGTGASGFGRYHGRAGFDAFSQKRGVLRRPFWPDFRFRYPPYKLPLGWLKKLF